MYIPAQRNVLWVGDFPRFGNSQMFKFWYRLFFLGEGESSKRSVVTLCNRPAALDAPGANSNYNYYTSVYMSMLTDFIIIKRKTLALLTDAQKEIWAGEVMVGKSMRWMVLKDQLTSMSFDWCTYNRLVQSAASETVQILSVRRRALALVPNDFLFHDEDCHHVVSTLT